MLPIFEAEQKPSALYERWASCCQPSSVRAFTKPSVCYIHLEERVSLAASWVRA